MKGLDTKILPRLVFPFLLVVQPLLLQSQGQDAQSHKPWNLGQHPVNWSAGSNLDIENRCKRSHRFEVVANALPFLQFSAPAQKVLVAGHKTKSLPVKFNTSGMQVGEYNGQVIVRCLDYLREPSCVQDRDVVPAHLILGETPAAAERASWLERSTIPEPSRRDTEKILHRNCGECVRWTKKLWKRGLSEGVSDREMRSL